MTCRTCDCADKAADTDEWVTFAKRPEILPLSAPAAPTPLAPLAGATVDEGKPVTFSWQHQRSEQEARARRAEAEVTRLTAERDALAAQVARVEALAEWFDSVQAEHLSQDDCQCEMKDCYECGPWHACIHNGPPGRARQIRDALAGSDADTGEQETGHRCEPYYSRSECGQCGWQEQWCVTCSRQMCGCATETTEQEDQP